MKEDNTACVPVLNHPRVCPEKGSPIKTASWEPILTDAMPWAGPGHWKENHSLPRSRPETTPCLSSSGQCRCDHREHSVLPAQLSYFGKSKPEEVGSQQTHTLVQLSHSSELAAGREWGDLVLPSVCRFRLGTATMKLVELLEYNMGVNSYSVYGNCLPSSVPSCAQTNRKV